MVFRWLKALFRRADQSLQARILIPTTVLFAVTLAAMALFAVRLAHAMNERSVARSAELFARVTSEGMTRAVEDRGPSAIPLLLAALALHGPTARGELISVSVVDESGLRAFSTQPALAGSRAWAVAPKLLQAKTIGSEPGELIVLQPLLLGTAPALSSVGGHWLEVRFSREADVAAEDALAKALVLTAIPSLLLLLGITWWLLGHQATRPLGRLVAAMRRAGEGDATVRADEGYRDELGVVARSFDATFAALQHSRAELEAVHRDRMERADRFAAVGEMATGLSHEIKNPLAGLSVALEILAEDPGAAPRAEMIAEMRHQVTRLIDIMEGLLGFVREHPPRMQDTNLNELVERAVRLGTRRCRSTCALAPDPRLDPTLPLIHGDPAKLEQVFLNLVLNACQAMHGIPGGGHARLDVSTFVRGSLVVVEIADSGPGIPLAVQADIFKPFFTTRKTGNGLGLAISERIVLDHGGHITFRCPPTGGTVFTVALPAATAIRALP